MSRVYCEWCMERFHDVVSILYRFLFLLDGVIEADSVMKIEIRSMLLVLTLLTAILDFGLIHFPIDIN